MSRRAVTPLVGAVLLVLCVLALSVVVGAAAMSFSPLEPAPQVVVSATADADDDKITVTHKRGDPLDARELRLVVEIDDTPLDEQPSYESQRGFNGFPSGPISRQTDPE